MQDVLLAMDGRSCSSRAHPLGQRRSIGARLRLARERMHLSAWDVFLAAEVDGRRLLAIERGVDPSLAEAYLLTQAYGIRLEDLVSPARVDINRNRPTVSWSTTPTHGARGSVTGP